jgi:hypothetical protein
MCKDSKQKQQISALEFNVPAARLSHPVPFKAGTYSTFYIAEKDSSGSTLLSPPLATRPL